MGVTDDHWCTLCQKKLDKAKDKYLDFELIHQAAKPIVKEWKKPRGLVCMKCIKKDPKLEALIDSILKASNPSFVADVTCHSFPVCETYQPSSKPNVNCRHIAVIKDTVYCKRSHPGTIKLMAERSERLRVERELTMRVIRKAFKSLPDPVHQVIETMFEQGISRSWCPPSGIIISAENKAEEAENEIK